MKLGIPVLQKIVLKKIQLGIEIVSITTALGNNHGFNLLDKMIGNLLQMFATFKILTQHRWGHEESASPFTVRLSSI